MENQHRKIKGYRDLSEDEIAAINVLKEFGERAGGVVEELRLVEDIDQRWVEIGITHLQQGFMALIRAIAQPEGF